MTPIGNHQYIIDPDDPNPLPVPAQYDCAITQNGTLVKTDMAFQDDTILVKLPHDYQTNTAILNILHPLQGTRGQKHNPFNQEQARMTTMLNTKSRQDGKRRKRTKNHETQSTYAPLATNAWKRHVFAKRPQENTLPRKDHENSTIESTTTLKTNKEQHPRAMRMKMTTASHEYDTTTLEITWDRQDDDGGATTMKGIAMSPDGRVDAICSYDISTGEFAVLWNVSQLVEMLSGWQASDGQLRYAVAWGRAIGKDGRAEAAGWSETIEFKINSVPGKPSSMGMSR